MTRVIGRVELVELVDGDSELVELLISHEILIDEGGGFGIEAIDRLLAARTLLRDLGVNVEGVEVVLHLRQCLAEARHRLRELTEDES